MQTLLKVTKERVCASIVRGRDEEEEDVVVEEEVEERELALVVRSGMRRVERRSCGRKARDSKRRFGRVLVAVVVKV